MSNNPFLNFPKYLASLQNPLNNENIFRGGLPLKPITQNNTSGVEGPKIDAPYMPVASTRLAPKHLNPTLSALYLDHMGSDITVVNAARVSFGKKVFTLTDKDHKLLTYLAKHNHWSPFSHPQLSFHIKAPIFVARQLHKHMIGLNISLAHNEISRRYVDDEVEFYTPDNWRKRPDGSVKQGSGENVSGWHNEYWSSEVKKLNKDAATAYTLMLSSGIAPEMARMVLPQSAVTEWIWTGSLLAFLRIIELRCDEHAQYESRVIAEQIKERVQEHFPVSYEAWSKRGNA